MKLFIFIVLSVMLVATTALAAAEVPTSRGDKAMVFMFDGLCFLSAEGYGAPDYGVSDDDYAFSPDYGFGMRYYIADGTAIRAGFQFGKLSVTDEDEIADPDTDATNDKAYYGVNAVYERHMGSPCSSVSPYWGFGAAYSRFSDKTEDEAGEITTDSGSGFAGFGVLGFEWGFTDCLTLGAEYMAGYASVSKKTETEPVVGPTVTSDEESRSMMGFSTASVYLSVYF